MSQFLLKDHTHFVIGLLLKLGFLISWKKSELVPSQDFIFLGENYRTDLGLVFPKRKISIVSTSSSIFTTDRFSDFSDGWYSSGPSTYTTNSVVPEGVLASSYSNVGDLYSCSSQTTASSSVVVTEVQPFDRCTSGPPRFHTDSLHRRLPRRENNVRGVERLPFRRTHNSSVNGRFRVKTTEVRRVHVHSSLLVVTSNQNAFNKKNNRSNIYPKPGMSHYIPCLIAE